MSVFNALTDRAEGYSLQNFLMQQSKLTKDVVFIAIGCGGPVLWQ